MAKLKFNADPTFQMNVEVPIHGGNASVLITYKHRTRKDDVEFAKDVQARYAEINSVDVDVMNEVTASVLMDMMVGWEFAEPLTHENVKHIINEHSAAASALAEAYWESTGKARVGNSKP